eukprot:CAMPEP_0202048846 /NCGR_PEP_ID=MMETSP0963-20130614/2999_1 /ASSEMBLY_ACC=CAM_ASM_000494 /TAXON_ID=4773 /ORGANISM="Schizochytrium aggregatum, Strain ATCC28209" /LENGTH=234 /DNA_ID=CAMNT_0048613807 /DNA_START=156 /DNA_END=860 /DNA_ORIENTATION=+
MGSCVALPAGAGLCAGARAAQGPKRQQDTPSCKLRKKSSYFDDHGSGTTLASDQSQGSGLTPNGCSELALPPIPPTTFAPPSLDSTSSGAPSLPSTLSSQSLAMSFFSKRPSSADPSSGTATSESPLRVRSGPQASAHTGHPSPFRPSMSDEDLRREKELDDACAQFRGRLELMRRFYSWKEIPLDFFVDSHVTIESQPTRRGNSRRAQRSASRQVARDLRQPDGNLLAVAQPA